MGLHFVLEQYFKPSIVYIFSFLVEIPHWQSEKHCKANSDIFSILSHQLRVLIPPLGVVVAMLDGCTVGRTWELLSMLPDARGLSGKCGVWCQSNAWLWKDSSPSVLGLVSRRLIDEGPGGCARWRLGRFGFVNQRNKFDQEIAGSRVYISLLPACPSILFCSWMKPTASILNYLGSTWLAQKTASCSKTHPISYTTLYVSSGLPSATSNSIIMLMPLM